MEKRPLRYHQDLVTQLDPLSHVSEAFKITRTNMEFSSIDAPAKLIAVTSSNQSEGKTATISNLAVTYAQIGRRVLLIDADMRRPAVHRLFGLSNRRGLTNALISKGDYNDYVVETPTENLFLLPSGPIPPNPAEILMSDSFTHILEASRSDFDLVLVDSPPVGVVTDGAIVASKVDGVVYVVRAGKVDRRQLQRAASLLKQVKARVLGYILNGVNEDTDDYYYMYYQQDYYADQSADAGKKNKRKNKKAKKQQMKQQTQTKNKQQTSAVPRKKAPHASQTSVRAPQTRILGNEFVIPSLEHDARPGESQDSADTGAGNLKRRGGLVTEDD